MDDFEDYDIEELKGEEFYEKGEGIYEEREKDLEERQNEDYEKIYEAYSKETENKNKSFLQLAISILFFLFIAYLIVRFIFGAWISIFLFMIIFSVLAAFTYLTIETS